MSNLEIETTRFGTVSVDGDRVLEFHPDCLALPTRPGGFCCSPTGMMLLLVDSIL